MNLLVTDNMTAPAESPGSRPGPQGADRSVRPPTNPLAGAGRQRLLPAVVAGLVVGVMTVLISISFAALIFSGPLAPHVGAGIGMALLTAIVAGGVVALTSSYAGSIAIPQDRAAPILALMGTMIVAALPGAPAEVVFGTVVASVVLASLFTGLALGLLGAFRLGNLIRFVPFPVIGGFLAGTGWLLALGAIKVMSGVTVELAALDRLFQPAAMAKWLPGIAFGGVLLLVTRRFRSFLTMPTALLSGVLAFHVVRALSGVDVESARAAGWLLGPFPAGNLASLETLASVGSADWGVLLTQSGAIVTVFIISAVSILLNASALELAARTEIDFNRELLSAGAANLLAGAGGGLVGFHSLSMSGLVLRMGVQSRLVGLIAAAVAASALFFGASVLGYFPTPVVGGLLFFLGLSFLMEWLWDARHRLPMRDYVVVLVILAVVGAFGYLQGVGVGILAAVILFLVSYSRMSVVRHRLTGAENQSNVARPSAHGALLQRRGDEVYILHLQAYIFFATANNLVEEVRRRVAAKDRAPIRYVVLDFRRVGGLDTSAVMSLVRLEQLAEKQGFRLLITEAAPKIRRQLDRGTFGEGDTEQVRYFADLDHGLEWCENEILRSEAQDPEPVSVALSEVISGGGKADPEAAERLLSYLERIEVGAGNRLIRQGDPADCLYILESGRVTVLLELDGGVAVRLQTIGAGTVVGEVGMYRGEARSASVVADRDCVVWRMSADTLERLAEVDPPLAASFHRFIARLLADRLVGTNRTLRAVLE